MCLVLRKQVVVTDMHVIEIFQWSMISLRQNIQISYQMVVCGWNRPFIIEKPEPAVAVWRLMTATYDPESSEDNFGLTFALNSSLRLQDCSSWSVMKGAWLQFSLFVIDDRQLTFASRFKLFSLLADHASGCAKCWLATRNSLTWTWRQCQ
jgi:hypothetical protein